MFMLAKRLIQLPQKTFVHSRKKKAIKAFSMQSNNLVEQLPLRRIRISDIKCRGNIMNLFHYVPPRSVNKMDISN